MRLKKIPSIAKGLKEKDSSCWKIFRRIQALAFFPLNEVKRALKILMVDRQMRPALPVLRHMKEYYVKDNARFDMRYWNHYGTVMRLGARTTNFCEGFNSRLNAQMCKGVQFFKVVYKIELYSVSVERIKERFDGGKGLDTRHNTRYNAFIDEMITLRDFLDSGATFEDRFEILHNRFSIAEYMSELDYERLHNDESYSLEIIEDLEDTYE